MILHHKIWYDNTNLLYNITNITMYGIDMTNLWYDGWLEVLVVDLLPVQTLEPPAQTGM